MRRPLTCFIAFIAAYLAVIGFGWFRQAGTDNELLGHAAKIGAIVDLLRSGDFAWFPQYLGGAPTASLLSFALAVPVYAPALWLIADPATAMKATALVLLALGGFGAFAFGRRLSGESWAGFAVGCAWLLAPQLLQRAGMLEHMTILVAIPLVPLAFLAMLRVAERGALFDAILLGVACSAALLAWSKMGATLVIPLSLFAIWLFFARPACRLNLLRGLLWAVPVVILLAVIPLIPLLRERAFMAVFEMDPFRAWQSAYSMKSGTAWLDRAGALFQSLPLTFRIDHGGYYLGLVGLAAVAWTVFTTWRNDRLPREVAIIRVFLIIALTMSWISFGPRNVLQGHFELLTGAAQFPDFAVTLHWLVLAAQGVFIFWCLPMRRWRVQIFIVVFAIYLFVPVFKLLEQLPLYADLRAPDSFWILNGSFAWAVASALAVVFVLHRISNVRLRASFGALALVASCADISPYFGWFYRDGIAPKIFADYRAVAEHLRGGKGRVLPVTTRYFYLDLPALAGRPLSNEALNHYLMPRDTARMQAAARMSATGMLAYFQLAGIRHVLLDTASADKAQKWFRSLLPVEFENGSFAVLSNPRSLYPGFFAAAAVPAPGGYDEYMQALEQAKAQRLVIASPPAGLNRAAATGFTRLDLSRTRTNGMVSFSAPGRDGWIVLSESWHPDWKATVDGRPAPVYRAAGGYPAVQVGTKNRAVEFRFRPPAWVAGCLVTGSFGWLAAVLFLGTARWLPRKLRTHILDERVVPMAHVPEIPRPPVSRPLALIPTYNESESIVELLDRALAANEELHALVIDDGSPDGTAARVRGHSAFGGRIHLLERPHKQGLGSAYRDGFRWALERNYDVCIEMDADLSHDPADIPRLLAALDDGADAAIGSRYLDGLRVVNWPRHRLWLSTGASRYVRSLTRLPLTDATSGFKALRSAALERIDWQHLRADGYGFQVELHWLLWKEGFRMVEVPIVFTERRAGRTKMTAAIAVEAAWRVLQLAVIDTPRAKS
ncbi:MAG: glycosyltransferase [Chthoniobacterales bacterium]